MADAALATRPFAAGGGWPGLDTDEPLVEADWVFGYGSLIWDPGFEAEEALLGRLHGYHRAFCIRSTRYRGTPESPGVVLGLDRGGSCTGMAFRLPAATRRQTIRMLYEREMPNRVYVPKRLAVTLVDGRDVQALAFVANRASHAYERLSDDEILRRLNGCCGLRGENRDYAINTWRALTGHGVFCQHLGRIAQRLLQPGG
ncbi:MAG TPA: gamma-glutamylcyclotransferase [Burkholderiaceae bacterium]|nr:gamma-glutamylcyclotransferase [Burkholderiaceae bacterium]